MKVELADLTRDRIDDRITVCGEHQPFEMPGIRRGIRLKKRWLRKMLAEVGSVSKLVYVDGKPAGQITHYPKSSVSFLKNRHREKKGLYVLCTYVRKAYQGKDFGKKLFKALAEEIGKEGKYNRLETKSFDPQTGFPQTQFWRQMGFTKREGGTHQDLEYVFKGEGKPIRKRHLTPKAVKEKGVKIFYEPRCIFMPYFNHKAIEIIHEIGPNVKIEEINMWERPEEAIRRNLIREAIYVNGHPVTETIFNPAGFKQEVAKLLHAKPK